MNKLSTEKRAMILRLLVEGMSMRSITRTLGCSINTVTKLLEAAGTYLGEFQDEAIRNLPCTRLEVDEAWSFVYAKQKNVARAKSAPAEAGDVWTWTAICADTKLIPSWRVGDRSAATAVDFMDDLRKRLRNRVQLSSDGHRPYLIAVEEAFGGDVDYAMIVKEYGNPADDDGSKQAHRRYSPGTVNGVEKTVVVGSPNLDLISTSYAERSNLTLRMSMRRFTRLTNAFSKKLNNHALMVALFTMYYNYCRPHKTLGRIHTTPAMAAKLTDRVWKLEDLIAIIDERTPPPAKPGPKPKARPE
ncbi:MAG: helix-turn-helix domain-containing protein [Spirochaetaceae bacterium]|nr:helix-turn-helix domain-containing protein [Spirochaetaceae bacterium]